MQKPPQRHLDAALRASLARCKTDQHKQTNKKPLTLVAATEPERTAAGAMVAENQTKHQGKIAAASAKNAREGEYLVVAASVRFGCDHRREPLKVRACG
jgi:hypothetical protein